jgi:hypothetical protein
MDDERPNRRAEPLRHEIRVAGAQRQHPIAPSHAIALERVVPIEIAPTKNSKWRPNKRNVAATQSRIRRRRDGAEIDAHARARAERRHRVSNRPRRAPARELLVRTETVESVPRVDVDVRRRRRTVAARHHRDIVLPSRTSRARAQHEDVRVRRQRAGQTLTQYPVPAERVSVVFEGDDGDARARHSVTSVFASARGHNATRDARVATIRARSATRRREAKTASSVARARGAKARREGGETGRAREA